jgi:rod shape-determining protein MreD
VLIGNNICIGGYATPFIYIYFILKLDSDASRNSLMIWAFSLGFIIDIFSNTLGMNTVAVVLLAFLRPLFLNLFISRDSTNLNIPSIRTMGRIPYWKYLITSIFIHHSILLSLEFFSFSDMGGLLLRILTGSLLTFVFIIAIDSIRK